MMILDWITKKQAQKLEVAKRDSWPKKEYTTEVFWVLFTKIGNTAHVSSFVEYTNLASSKDVSLRTSY